MAKSKNKTTTSSSTSKAPDDSGFNRNHPRRTRTISNRTVALVEASSKSNSSHCTSSSKKVTQTRSITKKSKSTKTPLSSKLSTTSKIQLDQFKIPLKSNSFTSSSSLVRDNFSYSDACRSYSSCDSITSSGSDWKPVSSISSNKRKDSSSIELDSSSKKKKTTKIKKDTQKISKKISKKTNSKVKHAGSSIDENSEKFQELSDALNSIENKALTKLILNTFSTFSKSNEMLKTMNEQLVSNNNTLAEALVVSNQLIRNSTNVKESSQASIEAHSTATPKTNSTSPLTSNPISVCNSKPKISCKASIEASSTPTSKTIINPVSVCNSKPTISSKASIEAHSTSTSKTNSTSPLTSNPVSVCNSKPKISSKASMAASSTPSSKIISTCQLTTKPIDVEYDISQSRDVYKTRDSYEPDDAGSIGPQFIPPDHNNQKNNAKFYELIDLSDFEKMAHDPKFIFNPTMPDTEKRKPTSTKASTRLVYAPDENNHRRRERLKFVIGYRHIILRGKNIIIGFALIQT